MPKQNSKKFAAKPAAKILVLACIVFLAAGCNLFSSNSGGLLGPIKTIDGGSTWLADNSISNDAKNNLADVSVTEMQFSPATRATIFMGTINNGLWKSTDSGNSWQSLLALVTVYDFFIGQNPNIIFAAGIYNNHGKIIQTTDGGKTWKEVFNEASTGNAVNTITANPNNPSELYAGLNSGVIIKSTDSGQTWSVVQQYRDNIFRLRYNPLNNKIYALLHTSGIYESSDSGVTWTPISGVLTNNSGGFSLQTFIGPAGVGEFFKMALDDQVAGVIYTTTDQGIYKTTDDGANWQLLKIPVKKDVDQTARAIASTKGGMLAYTSIGSTIYKTLDGGDSWQTQSLPTNSIINRILIDPVLPQISYAGILSQ